MMEILKNDTSLWLAFSFVIFVYILWAKGWPVIRDALDRRIEDIRTELKNAENLRVEAQEMLAHYQRKHRDSMREAEAIIRNAEKQAEHMRVEAEDALQEMLARREAQLQEKLMMMKREAVDEIRRYAADLSIEATRAIIDEAMDSADHDRLTDQSIRTVTRSVH